MKVVVKPEFMMTLNVQAVHDFSQSTSYTVLK